MRIVYNVLAPCIALAIVLGTALAYFVRKLDVNEGILYDGQGRSLSVPPPWAKVFITEPVWAGLAWHLGDLLLFFGGIVLVFYLYGLGQNPSINERAPVSAPIDPKEADMLQEYFIFLASEEYESMSTSDRQAALAAIKSKHGFSE